MKVQRIELDNYKALAGKHEFNMNGCSFFLLGGNGLGKTSVGRIVMDLLTKNLPSTPVTEGEKQGYVEITLDNGDKIFYRFSDVGKPVLEIIAANGGKYSNINDLFKQMAGTGMQFDINEFLKMAPKPRRAMLEKIAGVDFAKINEAERQAEENRKAINSRLKDAKARVVHYDSSLVTKQPVNITELSDKLTYATTHNKEVENRIAENDRISADSISQKDKIEQLKAEIKKAEDKIAANIKLYTDNSNWISNHPAIDESVITEIRSNISQADAINRSIDAAKAAHKDMQFVEDMEEKAVIADAEVKNLRAEKDSMILAAKLPAAGLSFSPDGETLLLDGFTFEDTQVATSRKMIAAIQIAESLLGTIKFLHLDGSILDKSNATLLLDWAESKGLQLAVERSLWEGGELKFEVYSTESNG
jgi:recombinational DNA repair ATPase RecF